ncbi:Dihydropteridine reductase [Strongyloides ratti]|uniref:Dihydropteridine reductase n=1 Tax=Strongyloides ratti TaxID=34506 RepID=A0A090L9V6_STRRB|nr:Dihydropteridine reductase [Strongyloides ratti]CEF64923.1 Dihydropteridine reductase [Strongyloides ratti]
MIRNTFKIGKIMSSGKVLVYGGKGALGSKVVEIFKENKYHTISIDLTKNEHADNNIVVDSSLDQLEQEKFIMEEVKNVLGDDKLDGVFCVAGGWAGGNSSSTDFVKNCDMMWKQSVWSSVISSAISSKYLKEGGILQLTGAAAAETGTPGMIGYGMAKAAVHHLVKSLSMNDSGLPKNCNVLAILPITLDTPMNRKWMPKGDFSSWTPLTLLGEKFLSWTTTPSTRPSSGSLLKIVTKNNETSFIPL